jgi:hypothetical protein
VSSINNQTNNDNQHTLFILQYYLGGFASHVPMNLKLHWSSMHRWIWLDNLTGSCCTEDARDVMRRTLLRDTVDVMIHVYPWDGEEID